MTEPTTTRKMIRILFVSADPKDARRLRLGEEVREIQESLRRNRLGKKFELVQAPSTRAKDLIQAMIDFKPDVVHFSGHGGKGVLWLEDDAGKHSPASAKGLAMMFQRFEATTSCVVLNACSSKEQAEAIAPYAHHVISTQKPISDAAAIAFSTGFYKGLGSGDDAPEAFNLGRANMELVESGSGRIMLLREGQGRATLNAGRKSPPVKDQGKPLCFVIMSFSGNPQLEDFYEQAVKPAVEKSGLRCERVDDQEFNGSIKDKIIDNLKQAHFVIADVTEARPNVYYELGLAHALDKPVIHLALNKADIHFDVNGLNFIIYSRIPELKQRLARRIQATLEEIKAARLRLLWAIPESSTDVKAETDVLGCHPKIDVVGRWHLQEGAAEPTLSDEFDAVLYSYHSSAAGGQKQGIRKLVNFIAGLKSGPPLIIYTTGRIEGEDFTIISAYKKRKIANMPDTLREVLEDVASAKRLNLGKHP
jgi:hypothetical protein